MKFRTHLIKLAREGSDHPRSLHAALIARGKSILASGVNSFTEHAETCALFNATQHGHDIRGATLYTLMVRARTGSIGNGSPCPDCMEAMRKHHIKRVIVYL
jgi:pyrimidine deaminase RibD-like protein